MLGYLLSSLYSSSVSFSSCIFSEAVLNNAAKIIQLVSDKVETQIRSDCKVLKYSTLYYSSKNIDFVILFN